MAPRKRLAQVAAFGRYLERLRMRRYRGKAKPERVAAHLIEKGVKTSGGSLRGYELGWNAALDPVVLGALADLYEEPVGNLIAVLAANRQKPDLSDFEVNQLLHKQGRVHDAASSAAVHYFQLGSRLAKIGVELNVFADQIEALRAQYLEALESKPRGQTSEVGHDSPDSNTDH